MRYTLVINDEERRDNGDEGSFADVQDEIHELLRSGYFQLESIKEYSD